MTRIVAPYVPGLRRPEAKTALAGLGQPVEEIEHPADDPLAYLHLVADLWRSGDDVLLIEQDAIVSSVHIAGIEACPAPWCIVAAPYPDPTGANGYVLTGACWRARGTLTRAHPEIADLLDGRPWWQFDRVLHAGLMLAGEVPCPHGPPLIHLARRSAACVVCRGPIAPAWGSRLCVRCETVNRADLLDLEVESVKHCLICERQDGRFRETGSGYFPLAPDAVLTSPGGPYVAKALLRIGGALDQMPALGTH
ncbi:MAG: hypothetical protein EPN50_05060 [Chloroflexota bacterium]|nr:MAG: hypothetical protein EPN50_05060 [Chloroflexota bacterium]